VRREDPRRAACCGYAIAGLGPVRRRLHHVDELLLADAEAVMGFRRCRKRLGQPDACLQFAVEGTDPPRPYSPRARVTHELSSLSRTWIFQPGRGIDPAHRDRLGQQPQRAGRAGGQQHDLHPAQHGHGGAQQHQRTVQRPRHQEPPVSRQGHTVETASSSGAPPSPAPATCMASIGS
jgi:hypothetical protein